MTPLGLHDQRRRLPREEGARVAPLGLHGRRRRLPHDGERTLCRTAFVTGSNISSMTGKRAQHHKACAAGLRG